MEVLNVRYDITAVSLEISHEISHVSPQRAGLGSLETRKSNTGGGHSAHHTCTNTTLIYLHKIQGRKSKKNVEMIEMFKKMKGIHKISAD